MEKILDSVFKFVIEAHKGQKRKFTDVDYVTHPMETANILWEATDHNITTDILSAALLHDVIEDTHINLEDIKNKFGSKIAYLVLELTSNKTEQLKMGKKNYLLNKINNMTSDAFTIKLADRLSNVSDLTERSVPKEYIKKYTEETLFILKGIKRKTNDLQKQLIDSITRILLFLTLNKDIGG